MITIEQFVKNVNDCVQKIEEIWFQIPSVNVIDVSTLKNGTLVRFRGMIQDMHSPEYYLEQYEVENTNTKEKCLRSGKYQDVINVQEDENFSFENSSNVSQERQTFVITSTPGLNRWVRDIEKEKNVIHPVPSSSFECKQNKRKIDQDNDEESMEVDNQVTVEENKKICTDSKVINDSKTTNLSPEFLLNTPLLEDFCKTCLVKMYENYSSLKINDQVEIVGFLAVDSVSPMKTGQPDEEDQVDMETQIMYPPASLIPRIHCVLAKSVAHDNPLISNPFTINVEDNTFCDAYKDLHLVLTQVLLGDKLAVDYLICHLISKVYFRRDVFSLGHCSLNISKVPSTDFPDYVKMLYSILELILPKSHYFPMTLENMNTLEFTPKKDYECNRLTTGLLQLSANTHLVVDECQLQTGRLDQMGVLNVQALANVIKDQRVGYDFKFYQMHYDTDIPVLVFSEGKSLLPSDFHVPLASDSDCVKTLKEIFEAANHFLNRPLLDQIRQYLTLARHAKCELSTEIEETVQEDFVSMRKEDANINTDDLHRLLVLARLVTLSQGHSKVGIDSWRKAKAMESERRSRLKTNES